MKRTCTVEVGGHSFKPWESDPFLTPAWHYEDAQRLANGEDVKWSSDDPAIVECAAYLRALANAHDEQELAAVRSRWPILIAAHEIAQQDGPKRWELESRILANQPVEAITARCEISPDVIVAYEASFFDVRVRLGARMWITYMVIGDGIQRGFLDHEVGPFWASYGYHGGHIAVDAVVDAFHAARRPDEPMTLSIYLRPDRGIDPKIQADVAANVLPPYGSAGEAWQWVRIYLAEADAADDQDRRALLRERAQDWLVRCARNYLAGEPLPRQSRRRQTPKDRRPSKTGKRGSGTQRTSVETMVMEAIGSAMVLEPGVRSTGGNAGYAPLRRS